MEGKKKLIHGSLEAGTRPGKNRTDQAFVDGGARAALFLALQVHLTLDNSGFKRRPRTQKSFAAELTLAKCEEHPAGE